jgi:glycerophosphoryl diester phosphodiesterase
VIAHRGASWDERENTVPAFERAILDGADFVELDVQATRDGGLVVFHDRRLERLTPLTGAVCSARLDELTEVGVPSLEEVLEVTRGRVGVMAEVKGAWRSRRHDLVRRTAALLGETDVLLSFERRALLEARGAFPRLRLLQHVGAGVSIRTAATYAWAVGFHDARVTPRALASASRIGLRTTVYTVNDAVRMAELVELGVGGIFTDRPALLRSVLARG